MIHHYNIIIQIVIYLGFFITSIISVSQNEGDFIMGVLSILVFQAPQPFIGQLVDSHHELTITQLLSSRHTALFDIDMKMVVYAVCPKC